MSALKPKIALLVACLGLSVFPALSSADNQACFYNEQQCQTGQRAAAVNQCKKNKHGSAKQRCLKKARKLPV